MTRTPLAGRPSTGIPFTGQRITRPFLVIIITSSVGRTSLRLTRSPLRPSVGMQTTPLPPRWILRKSMILVRFP